jgi:uncharacterized protein (TIGR02285 family)
MKRSIIPFFVALLLVPFLTEAKDVIYWQRINWPPFQILRGEDAGRGRADIIEKILQNRLPQYEHRNVEMNWSRYWKEVRAGKHILNTLAIKTDERSRYAVFSDVATFSLPHRIIMKKSTLAELGNPEAVLLSEFLRDQRVRGIIEQARSYSPGLDKILKSSERSGNFSRGPLEIASILRMILSGRVDYTIEYPFVVDYVMKKHHTQDMGLIGGIKIQELPPYVIAHVAAPKNQWGIKVIHEINHVIGSVKSTDDYMEAHVMWHSDAGDLRRIRSIYEKLFQP